jgi:hypothetical protein
MVMMHCNNNFSRKYWVALGPKVVRTTQGSALPMDKCNSVSKTRQVRLWCLRMWLSFGDVMPLCLATIYNAFRGTRDIYLQERRLNLAFFVVSLVLEPIYRRTDYSNQRPNVPVVTTHTVTCLQYVRRGGGAKGRSHQFPSWITLFPTLFLKTFRPLSRISYRLAPIIAPFICTLLFTRGLLLYPKGKGSFPKKLVNFYQLHSVTSRKTLF